jgi:hypothetical protein
MLLSVRILRFPVPPQFRGVGWDLGLCPPSWGSLTFALQTLAEKTLEKFLASLANGGPRVAVDEKGVRHLDLGEQHLVQLDGAAGVE